MRIELPNYSGMPMEKAMRDIYREINRAIQYMEELVLRAEKATIGDKIHSSDDCLHDD